MRDTRLERKRRGGRDQVGRGGLFNAWPGGVSVNFYSRVSKLLQASNGWEKGGGNLY
jgi:hypothetical protein